MTNSSSSGSVKWTRDSMLLIPATSYSAPTDVPRAWLSFDADSLRRAARISTVPQHRPHR